MLSAAACLAGALAGCGDDVPASVAPGGLGGSGYQENDSGTSPWAHRDGSAALDANPGVGGHDDDAGRPDAAQFNCPEVPTAYVMEYADPYTGVVGDARQLLAAAGFDVQTLPLDRDPRQLRGLIYFGSFVSESPDYRDYLMRNPTNVYTFVDAGNVLIQMTQADQTEFKPPFLPNSQTARRTDTDLGALAVLDPQHPLLAGVALDGDGNLAWKTGRVGWETFGAQTGFAVLLAADHNATSAALMEGAYAQGRFILTAMALDKPEGPGPDRDQFNQAFYRNLYQYTRDVCRRQTRAVNVTPSPGAPVFGNGAFTLAVLPDTQYYSLSYPGIYLAQVSWIVANMQRLRIPYVFHLGDIVDQNTPLEWQRASQAMGLLEGVVPYTVTTGNHDIGPSGNATSRDTLLNQYFSFERTAAWPTFGGAYQTGQLENTYHLFSAGGRDYIVLSLEWGPRDAVLAWADGVMAQNPRRYGILVTHAYVNNNDLRYDITDTAHPQDFNPHQYGTPGGVNDGEEIWQKLVRKHAFVMTLNGHVLGDGTGYLASVTDKGNTCHQMMSNYQFRAQGGEGYMRLLEFEEDNRTVKVYTYSPLYDS
ncbi:MAG TPA: metallophosphoesterase, partial [Polyangia bacterium]|nr:metallophosphoesterase [Polyangia bacterium]